MSSALQWILERSKSTLTALCLVLSLAIAAANYSTGFELSFGLLYMFPVFLAGWSAGEVPAILLAAFTTALWQWGDVLSRVLSPSSFLFAGNIVIRLIFLVGVALLAARLRKQEEEHKTLAWLDPLTSLPNRRAFLEVAERECRRSRRSKLSLTLAYIDLDNFKAVNDKYGHGVGDELLRMVAKTLQSSSRQTDTIARLGGDEFAMLLPETTLEGAKTYLENARQRLLKMMRSKGWPVTFSVGCITFNRPITVEEMIRRADALMYEVKQKNKNAINFELTRKTSSLRELKRFEKGVGSGE